MREAYDPQEAGRMFPADGWMKSTFSNGNGTGCVEFNHTATHTGLRDSNHPTQATLVFDREEWDAFVKAIHDNQAMPPA